MPLYHPPSSNAIQKELGGDLAQAATTVTLNNVTSIQNEAGVFVVNRIDSEDFSGLTNYKSTYKPKANRYGMGESANFIETPMAIKAIEQLIEWTPLAIQNYCYNISKDALAELKTLGFTIEDDVYRGHHLIVIEIPNFINIDNLKAALSKQKIFLSIRGNYIRVAPHLYSTKTDFDELVNCIKSIIN